ncbi:MAG: DUF6282 family protein [Chloroflexota bacterium]
MADQATIRGLISGAFDTHVHTSPDVLARKTTDAELARRALDHGMAGFVVKSHFSSTVDRATVLREAFPGLQAYGGIVLNHVIGGLNPVAVDIAGRLGGKVVWLPTVDAANERGTFEGHHVETRLPYWISIARDLRDRGISGDWIEVVNDDGKVHPRARQCLELIAHHDMVLATGHIAPREMLPIVRAAREAGVRRVIITHPEFPSTHLTIDEQKALLAYDVYFERCVLQPLTGKVEWSEVIRNVQEVGVSSTILATDLGQITNPYADEGLATFIDRLLDAGLRESDISAMVSSHAFDCLGI